MCKQHMIKIKGETQKIRLGTLNCGGFRLEREKRKLIFEMATLHKIDILLLQETNLRSQDEKKTKMEWRKGPCIFSASHDDAPFSGVAILCSSPETKILNPIFDSGGKMITADILIHGDIFHLINVHLPSSPTLVTFEPAITELHALMQSPYPVILGGDFNFVENGAIDRCPPAPNDSRYYLNRPWGEFKDIYNLKDIAQNVRPVLFTRELDNVFSRIDRLYTVPGVSRSNIQVKSVGVSDHRLLFADFVLDEQKKRGPGHFKCNAKVHDRPDFLQEVENITSSMMQLASYMENPKEWWQQYKKKSGKYI